MNKIDYNFKNLVNEIRSKNLEDIYMHILTNYLKKDSKIRLSIEAFLDKFKYWGNLNSENNDYEELHLRAETIKNHLSDYEWLYKSLNDYRSKQILYAILDYWYNSNFENLDKSYEKNYHQYFDLDIIRCDENEIFVDIGAYNGDTILNYINNYKDYKKVYAYEITKENIEKMESNLKEYKNIYIVNKAISDEKKTSFLMPNIVNSSANKAGEKGDILIENTTLDDDIKEKITFIKMDIEGDEFKAIKGAQNHIKNDTPKLAIAVYHNHADLWKIPKTIHEINSNYKYYLRYFGNKYYPTEIILIAIPK